MKTVRAGVAFLGVAIAAGAFAATPGPELQKRVRGATFEVVVPKPAEGNIEYERPPPYELLPFADRNDRYWSVGTAFAIAPGTFVTASHVLLAALGGQGGPPELRAHDGKRYSIETVRKFSLHQDFAVVTATGVASEQLATRRAPALDEAVFTVGNALGEGVVIRDGLLTSMTPEDEDGRWKWLRFSAATSPGNSGGPLLDERGDAIGVVIGKSTNENLNFALPIGHVLDAREEAVSSSRFPLSLPTLRDSFTGRFEMRFALPLTLEKFTQRLEQAQLDVYSRQVAAFQAQSADQIFPRGKSSDLIGKSIAAYCPMFIAQDRDRIWDVMQYKRDNVNLSDGGSICTREGQFITLFHIERGPTKKDHKFYSDSRAAMDLLLKGLKLPRHFGSEPVALTSLGAATSDIEVRDRFSRRWRLRAWPLPFVDAHIIALFLPTPDGFAGIAQYVSRGGLSLSLEQIRQYVDYFYVSYSGSIPQWQAFLVRGESLPDALKGVSITHDAAGALRFESPRIDFTLPASAMTLDDSSRLQVQMAYGADEGKPVWNIGAIYVSQDEDSKSYVGAIRQSKPASDADKDIAKRWADMLAGSGDFDGKRGHDSAYKKLWRRTAIGTGGPPPTPPDERANVLYEIVSVLGNSKLPREIDDLHDRVLENVQIKER